MKKYILTILFLLIAFNLYATPDSNMTITPSASDGATIQAADENTRNNAISSTYNAHSHTDITSLTSLASIGTVTTGTWNATAVGVAYGGTGGATASAARTNLGLAIGTDVQAYDADLTTYAGITPSANIQTFLGSADNATGRTNLGVAIGSNVQAYDADLDDLADGSLTGSKVGTGIAAGNITSGNLPWAQMASAAARIKVGTYTGDGAATKAITGVGFGPDFLIIWPQETSVAGQFMKTSSDGTKTFYDQGSSLYYENDYIISLDSDGFTVGDGTGGGTASHTNRNAIVYTYIAFGD